MNSLELYRRIARLVLRLAAIARRTLGVRKTTYVHERVAEYREIWSKGANQLGFEFADIAPGFWEVADGDRIVARISNYLVSLDDPVTLQIAGDKALTFELLQQHRLTIPEHSVVPSSSTTAAVEFLHQYGPPVVVKPARDTSSGLGVSTQLATPRDVAAALALSSLYAEEAIIERHVPGESYRLLYLAGELVAAARRRGVRVVGDGSSSLAKLIERLGESKRTALPASWRSDADTRLTLASQSISLDVVPSSGQEVLVRSATWNRDETSERRTVYDEDVTGILCASIVDECGKVARAIGSEFCGVDVITTDAGRSLADTGGVIDEVNTTPGLHHHYGLTNGSGTPVGAELPARVLAYCARQTV